MNTSANQAARSLENNKYVELLARLGYAVNGILHLLIGGIAIGVVTGSGSGSADQSGALGQLASTPGGVAVLWVVTVGLFALALWQVFEAILVPAQEEKRKWAHRAVEFGKAVAYVAVGVTAFTFASGGSSSSSGDTQSLSATVLGAPGGVLLLTLLGLAVVAIGGYFVFKGVTQKFREDISIPAKPAGTAVTALGVAGYVAKGIAIAVVGILLVVAAFTVDPSQATGLDGALKSLLELPFGSIILVLVGAGLIAFGIYSFARAKYARL
ncbi:DUF1206 domain-containing protein [Marisediminicola senii]|uniref:DUF1206 domain-containing protein n=1 Tax=Marisediminicola senii TaxID=2711233 RepID=UPI0013EA19DE|nr:DUF1206 domain-containing protein [Marisediminicola senii]